MTIIIIAVKFGTPCKQVGRFVASLSQSFLSACRVEYKAALQTANLL